MRFLIVLSVLFTLISPLLAQTLEGSAVFSESLRLQQAGGTADAIVLLRQIAEDKKYPLADYAQFEIGKAYLGTGNYISAIPEFNKVVTLHSTSLLVAKSTLLIGKSRLNLKNFPSAIKTFRGLVEKYPDAEEAAEARFLVAKALQQSNQWKEAYLAYEETDLYHPLGYFGKQSRLAINALKKEHKNKLPRFKASEDALFKKGMAYFEQDDFEMSANIFNRLAREYPKSKHIGEAWLMLGRAEMMTSSPSAISDLEKATQGPSNLAGRAHYYLGLAYGRRGNFSRAIASFRAVSARYPDSGLADDAAYWAAYYEEISGKTNEALVSYYNILNAYPYSKVVPTAIWRIGRTYYWNNQFKNAATYLHLAQLYPRGEDTPRCYFFEAKALERLNNRAAALEVYKKLVTRFDHTYYAYRAQEKINGSEFSIANTGSFNGEDFTYALSDLNEKNQQELAAIMEIWEQANAAAFQSESSGEARTHLSKYKELMTLGLTPYAADEARYLVNITSDVEKDSLQIKLGEVLIQSGEYRAPIRFADRKVKSAVIAGNTQAVPKKIWQLSYPKGYWKDVSKQAKSYGLDPYLVLAVIREESRFNARAVSRSSARGLMQIMPRTGRGIAKDLDLDHYQTQKLFTPSLNVEMGTYYLSNLVKNFSNNAYLALAGYNGGPNRMKKYIKSWYNGDLKLVDIDEFIESIPSLETRLYVQKVMGSYFEYKRLYDRKRG